MTMNDHPGSTSLDEYTSDELDKRYSDIMNRWRIAKRMNMNQNVLYQLDLLLGSIELEKERRLSIDSQQDGVIIDTDPIKFDRPYLKRK